MAVGKEEQQQVVSVKRRSVLKAGLAIPIATSGAAAAMMNGCASMSDSTDDLTALSAAAAARQINDGSLSAEKYASHLLARYESTRGFNAVTWINKDRVLESARRVDVMRGNGEKLGPLAGLPVALKDNIDAIGFPTTGGTPVLEVNLPKQNAQVVNLLLQNGAYVFGKTNMHELAKGATSSNMGYGAVRNPIDQKRIPGGSSGGSAAALAAGFVPLALGTDTAGSARIPAALCGVAGFRPSISITGRRKLYSDQGVLPLALDLDTIGPLARSVEDIALVHSVVTGSALHKLTSLKGIRIGVPRAYFYENLEPGVQRVIEQALLKLHSEGVVLVDIDLGDFARSAAKMNLTIFEISVRTDLEQYLASRQIGMTAAGLIDGIRSPDVKAFYKRLSAINATPQMIAHVRNVARPQLAKVYEDTLRANDVNFIAFPTEPIVAPFIKEGGDLAEDSSGKRDPQALALIRNTCTAAVVGAPGVTIPAGRTVEGLPVGLEFDGISGADNALLSFALAVEKVLAVPPGAPV
ncbi:amidase family protein [Comamonas sp. w2-DMI]|uniref:amidase family protein n=1 Tax=Comamonas sp. w2-DMI TaxID=3126391 RepID=UPI0032E429C2